jgi:putative transposase
MPRKLRLVFPDATYHVINRGNYRQPVFGTAGAAAAFESVVFEAVRRCGWHLHAYVVMKNHFHLAITTPQPNLVEGMQWLQVTFASRFNHYRREHGHLFQGRYKSLLVEPGESLVRVVDYIHLNPVRAKLTSPEDLLRHPWSSLRHYLHASSRPPELTCNAWLAALGLRDTPSCWREYLARLRHFGGDEDRQRRHGLTDLTRGWAIGTAGWRQAIAKEHSHLALHRDLSAKATAELREQRWIAVLKEKLRQHGKGLHDISRDRKGAPWKISIAVALRREGLAPYRWISNQLNMGHPRAVSFYVSQQIRLAGT